MSGETNLDSLIAAMEPVLQEGVYVFATVTGAIDQAALNPVMMFRESEGMTLILEADTAAAHGISGDFRSRMITLNIHSSLDAVGFLARITNRLAAEGMGVNPVSAYYHDHLFVPEDRAEDAMAALRDLASSA